MLLNISKVLLESIMYPVVHFKALLNAITLPIFIFICNWALGVKFGNDYSFLPWFSYIFQFYAISLLLTNCIWLITKNEVPNFLRIQSVYLKCTVLLIGYSVIAFVAKYLLFVVAINVFDLAESDNFWQLDKIVSFVSSIIVFSLFFVIPYYICTGKIRVVYVLKHIRKYFISVTLIILIIEVVKATIGYIFIDVTEISIILLGTIIELFLKAFGYIIISLCYMAIFSNKTLLNSEM